MGNQKREYLQFGLQQFLVGKGAPDQGQLRQPRHAVGIPHILTLRDDIPEIHFALFDPHVGNALALRDHRLDDSTDIDAIGHSGRIGLYVKTHLVRFMHLDGHIDIESHVEVLKLRIHDRRATAERARTEAASRVGDALPDF